jgi:formylglycine-generating enzyme required for sulfatase activity
MEHIVARPSDARTHNVVSAPTDFWWVSIQSPCRERNLASASAYQQCWAPEAVHTMETKPYDSRPPERLPMGWSDGRTLPATPDPQPFAAAPPVPPRRGLLIASVVGGLVVGGIALAIVVYATRTEEPSSTEAAVASGTTPTEPAKPSADAKQNAAPVPAAAPCPEGMVLVPGGKFFMGTDAEDPVLQTAKPAHAVEIGPYCIDIDEVTVDQYRECSKKGECKRAYRDSTWPQGKTDEADWRKQMEAHSELCNEQHEDRGDHPINCVDWAQARAFCQKRGGDLPSEAEWEFAARGSDGRVYPWGDAVPTAAHMNGSGTEYVAWRESKGLSPHGVLYEADDGFVGTAPVGNCEQGTTQYGLHDIAGNVFEWTLDEFRRYDDTTESTEEGPRKRVIRGGAFNSFQPQFADPALRFPQVEDAHNHGIGFRCVAEPRKTE